MNRRTLVLILGVVVLIVLQACGGAPTSQPGATKAAPTVQPTPVSKPTLERPPATSTPKLTDTPKPIATPRLTDTPRPTNTSQPPTPSVVKTIGTLYVSAGGEGVYIRSQPDREARVKVWPDGTAMGLIEKAPSGWAKVQAPDGYVGYIPLEYLADKIPPTRTPAPTQPPAPPPSASTVGGPPVTVNNWTWSVYEVKKEKAVYFYKDSAIAEGTFYILFLRITNGHSGTRYPEQDLDFYLLDASGKRYTTSRFEYYAQWQYGGKSDSFGEIQPGQTSEIILLYDVPTGATGLRLVGTRDGQGAISIP